MKKTKPLQIMLTEKERKALEKIRAEQGFRSWGATIRWMIKKGGKV